MKRVETLIFPIYLMAIFFGVSLIFRQTHVDPDLRFGLYIAMSEICGLIPPSYGMLWPFKEGQWLVGMIKDRTFLVPNFQTRPCGCGIVT